MILFLNCKKFKIFHLWLFQIKIVNKIFYQNKKNIVSFPNVQVLVLLTLCTDNSTAPPADDETNILFYNVVPFRWYDMTIYHMTWNDMTQYINFVS